MLTIDDRPIGRRDFLRVGSLGLGGITLADLLRTRARVASGSEIRPPVAHDKSVVLLWLTGGMSHIESFDPKPSAPIEYQSLTGYIETSLLGMQVGGNFAQLARVADKLAFVRSFAHRNSNHVGGTHTVMTGYDDRRVEQGEPPSKPSHGSIAAKYRGISHPRTGMPTYVKMGSNIGDGPVFLGKSYAAFEADGAARANMESTFQGDRMADRRGLLKRLDRLDRMLDASGQMNGLDAFEEQAYSLILGNAKIAFDLDREDAKTRARYGKDLGEQLLLARRLCEAGCGFVTVNHTGWDMHRTLLNGMNALAPKLDHAVAAFIDDCALRGLSDRILLVITGDFGRTPKINGFRGRDHWPGLSTLAFSGGGLRMGQIIGESSAKAEVPESKPITPQDLMATLFHFLDIPQDVHFGDNSGRPVPMLQGGKPIAELV
jgi:uncharacterized protein (DUF1501 family)